jgi:CDP-glucose 4,6-dehydratase
VGRLMAPDRSEPAFWRDRRVLVTGHTGFKGSWLVSQLLDLGARVTGLALDPPTRPAMFDLLELGAGMEDRRGDVRDAAFVHEVVRAARPEIVFHLAAQPLVRASYLAPAETVAVNVVGTANVLDACVGCDAVAAVVCVTTDKCYENREWLWGYREGDRLGGHDLYSASKAAAELVAAAWRRSFPSRGLAIATARAGNVIGGGDWSVDRLVPDAMRAFASGQPLRIRSPLSTRPWQHVLEPIGGYLRLAEACLADPARFADAWNFGPWSHDVAPVRVVADKLAAAWGPPASWAPYDDVDGGHEARSLSLDITKAGLLLDWRPRWSLDVTLTRTVAWYRAVDRGADAAALRALTREQIAAYGGGQP